MPAGPGVVERGSEHRLRRRRLAAVTAGAVALLLLLLAGCGGRGGGGAGGAVGAGGARGGRGAGAGNGGAIRGRLPAVGRPAPGGTITAGQLAKQTPGDIFPLVDGASCTTPTLNFVQNLYIPLYAGPDGSRPAIDERLSAAEPPRYSDGDATVTITLKPGLTWSDGKPVQAQDVVFYLDLLKAALQETSANWCQYSPGQLPDNIKSWAADGPRTVVLHLTHAVNPAWFTANQLQDAGAGIYPLPSQDWNVDAVGGEHITDWSNNPADALKIYDYLHAAGRDLATFTSRQLWKVVDGPFALAAFNAADGSYELVPNRSYGLAPKAQAHVVSVRTFASSAAMLAALESGTLDLAALDPSTQLHAIPKLRRHGFSVFGGPEWGWFGGVINYRDSADDFDKLIAQPYMRAVLAELVDQRTIIRRVYHGWAVPAHGPVPSAPRSPYVPSGVARAPWPYDPARAVATLRAHGWDVEPGGQTTCRKPGTGSGDCGAGIPKGTPIKLVWANVASPSSPVATSESQIFAADARRAAGIGVSFVSGTFGFLTADYNDRNPAAGAYVNDWAVNDFGGVYSNYYPTQDGLLSIGGSLNLGGYADATANRLMAASVASPRATAIAAEVSYLSRSYPVLYMPDQDWIMAVSRRIGGPAQAFRAMTLQQSAFQFLYRVRRR